MRPAARLRRDQRDRYVDAHDVGCRRFIDARHATAVDQRTRASNVARRKPGAMRLERQRRVARIADQAEAARRADRQVARGDGTCRRARSREVAVRDTRRRLPDCSSDVRRFDDFDPAQVQNSACRGARGNGITSRMFSIPVAYWIARSKPRPKPACGTVP